MRVSAGRRGGGVLDVANGRAGRGQVEVRGWKHKRRCSDAPVASMRCIRRHGGSKLGDVRDVPAVLLTIETDLVQPNVSFSFGRCHARPSDSLANRRQIHLLVSIRILRTSPAPVHSPRSRRHHRPPYRRHLPEKKLVPSRDLAGDRIHASEHDHVLVRPFRDNPQRTASGPSGLVRRRSRGCQLGSTTPSRSGGGGETSHVDVLRGAGRILTRAASVRTPSSENQGRQATGTRWRPTWRPVPCSVRCP